MNVMAANLTEQVRGIVKVVTAVANGDLKQNLTVKAKGEVAALAETINNMTDTLATFAEQVTTVAREVGVEGRLGGQANVPGAAGTWKDLTGNVNLLAANLTTQVRAIAEVATAVTKGDLTRSIQVEARGEVAELKDNINTMIDNLRLTTERNTEQDWLKTNLARFTSMLQGQRDLATVGTKLLSELAPLVNAHQGLIYQMVSEGEGSAHLKLLAKYADDHRNGYPARVGPRRRPDRPVRAREAAHPCHQTCRPTRSASGRRCSTPMPRSLLVLPVVFEDQIKAVIELASLHDFDPAHLTFLEQLTASIGIVLNSIEATMQTEGLLKQSQQLAAELQTQQKELQQTNEQLEQKAQQLAERNVEVEAKNQEIEQARRALEEKATELALTSKYKSEFLANMSHELRTPLNSILILGQQLGDNPDRNLTDKQVEFARTIHGAGTDLLNLISDILDLSKIESGTVSVDAEEIYFTNLIETVAASVPSRGRAPSSLIRRRTRQPSEPQHRHRFQAPAAGAEEPAVQCLQVHRATAAFDCAFQRRPEGWSTDHPKLAKTPSVVAFEVTDTGIGISPEKQKIIFEAFQQADASTSRKYGGTGLGLAISRELANLLGGEIQLRSTPGKGSTFTLYLPLKYAGPPAPSFIQSGSTPATRRAAGALPPHPGASARADRRRPRRSEAGRHGAAHRRGRSALRPHPRRSRARQRLQGAGRCNGRGCPGAGERLSPDRRLARRVPARHAGLDRAQPAQAESGDAPHSGADRHSGGGPPARLVARRVLVRDQAGHHRGTADVQSRASGTSASHGASACWWSRTMPPSASASPSCSHMMTSTSHRGYRRRRAGHPRRRGHATAWCSICGFRT